MTHVRPKNAKIDQHGRPLLEPWLIGVGPSPWLFVYVSIIATPGR